jgi:hypothetical protein
VFLVFIPSISYADLRGKVIWMDEAEMASEVVPKLEKFSKMEEEIKVIKEEIVTCEGKAEEFKQQLIFCNDAKNNVVKIMDSQKEAYEKIIEENKPSFFDKLKLFVSCGGLGILAGILLGVIYL